MQGVPDDCDLDAMTQAWLRRIEAKAQEWVASASPQVGVGSRHHTVPAFYLRYFAKADRLRVRHLPDGEPVLNNVDDLAQRNFYTVVTDDLDSGEARWDGRLEQVLQVVEGATATIFNRLTSPLFPRRPFTPDEQAQVAQFVAFQLVRGVRTRREQELMAEYSVKTLAAGQADGRDGRPSAADIAKVRVVPHPNHHLKMLGYLAQEAHAALADRPLCMIEVDRPLFIVCDEPVLVIGGDDEGHQPECFLSERQRRRQRGRTFAPGAPEVSELVHLRPTRPSGVGVAEEVAMPLSPRQLLLFGPRGGRLLSSLRLSGADADELAADVQQRLLQQAYVWVAAHPDHQPFESLELPEPGPLLEVCDGGTPLAQSLRGAPSPRGPERLRRD